tara:strand:+ start:1214 stop:1558 length:345 start_codon:yes stop_codon:yes gene_type:complete
MKMILAIVQPELLPDIKEALLKAKISKFTVSTAKGHGSEVPVEEVYRGISYELELLNKIRIEIAVNDDFVDPVVDAICEVTKEENTEGRGKIFISPIEDCIRIRTGQRGKEAIG